MQPLRAFRWAQRDTRALQIALRHMILRLGNSRTGRMREQRKSLSKLLLIDQLSRAAKGGRRRQQSNHSIYDGHTPLCPWRPRQTTFLDITVRAFPPAPPAKSILA